MCGFFGSNDPRFLAMGSLDVIQKSLYTRGPESFNSNMFENFLLCHSRLALTDLTANAEQPFISKDLCNVVLYNGEIFNFQSVKENHPEICFETRSDTEVLTEVLATKGLDGLNQLDGMYSFAWLDMRNKILTLGRDPIGMKPNYYRLDQYGLSFSSSLKLLKHQNSTVNLRSRASFFAFGFTQAPDTIFGGIHQLEPGEIIRIDTQTNSIIERTFRRYKLFYPKIHKEPISSTKRLLENTIALHRKADVPVGTMLSGGLDSSLVTSIASRQDSPVTAFSVNFDVPDYDERYFQTVMSQYCGRDIEHVQIRYTKDQFREDIARYLSILEYPLLDGLNSYIAANLISSHGFKSVLTGQGADEIFYGYNSFRMCDRLTHPKIVLNKFRLFDFTGHLESLDYRTAAIINAFLNSKLKFSVQQLRTKLDVSVEDLQNIATITVKNLTKMLPHEIKTYTKLQLCSALELCFRLPNELMIKDDFFCMVHSVETRNPFLSKALLEHVTSIPSNTILQGSNFQRKLLLKNIAKYYLPDEVIHRTKAGFSVPYKYWIEDLFLDDQKDDYTYTQKLSLGIAKQFDLL